MAIKVYIDQGHNPSSFNTGAEGNGYFEQDITYRIGFCLTDISKRILLLRQGSQDRHQKHSWERAIQGVLPPE